MKLKKKNPKDLSFILGCGATAKAVGQFGGLGIVTIQNMKNVGPIGSSVKESNILPGSASIYFATENSVSELIAQLTKMRKDMKNATKAISVRCSDKRGKVPGPRAKR